MKKKNRLPSINQSDRLFKIEKPLIGLTGSIATGKTTVSNLLQEYDATVICADKLIKKIYKYRSVKQFIKQYFPQAIIKNEIHFKTLRNLAFNNQQIKKQLEQELYQHLESEFKKELVTMSKTEYIFYDVPLLFENKLEAYLDYIVCVHIDSNLQRERLKKRDSITDDLAKKMISTQISIEQKKESSDFTIDNSSTVESTRSQVVRLLENLETLSRM